MARDDESNSSGADPASVTDADHPGAAAETGAETEPNPRTSRRRRRMLASALCAVLSVVFMLVGITGLWVMRTAANRQWIEREVADTLRDPVVSNELASTIVSEFSRAVDIDAKIRELVPPQLSAAVPILESTARNQIERRLAVLISSDQVVTLAARSVGAAQQGAVAVLNGDGTIEGVDVNSGEVRINLLPLIPRVVDAGQSVGLFGQLQFPDLEGMSRAQQLQTVSETIGRPLDEDFAHPVVFRSEAVAKAGQTLNTVRTVLLWSRRLFWLFLVLGAAFGAGAVFLARRRVRAACWLGGGFLAAVAVTRIVIGMAGAQLPRTTNNPGGRAAIAQVTNNAIGNLTSWFVWLGVIVAVAVIALAVLLRRSDDAAPAQNA